MEYNLVRDITVIFALSAEVIFLFSRIGVPSIIGFLLTGVLAGPYGFGLLRSIHEVEVLAEIGVVLLLFTIGIEFSLASLLRVKKEVLLGGFLQVSLTIAAASLIASMAGVPFRPALFFGFLLSLSSTAIVLKIIQERAETVTHHGKNTLAMLIFQDIAIVPLLLFTPLLAGSGGDALSRLPLTLGKAALVITVILSGARWIMPNVLYHIARTRSRELFLLSIILLCFSVAWITYSLGLSPALGAFLAGLIISESEYSHQAVGNILPFKDAFSSFFFVSIGMLLDVRFLAANPVTVLSVTGAVLFGKSIIASLATFLLGYPLRTSVITGIFMAQVGEFSFILAKSGLSVSLISQHQYQLFLAFTVMTMALTPPLMGLAPRVASLLEKLPLPRLVRNGFSPVSESPEPELSDHLIIVGYGVNGRNVARSARASGIPYVIIEMNPDTVRIERQKGEPIHYGDASQEEVLRHAGIDRARVMVVAIADSAATARVTERARSLSARIHMVIRTRFNLDVPLLYQLGADEVIPEEFETSVEIFIRVLDYYLVSRDDIERLVSEIRQDGYEMFRSLSTDSYQAPRSPVDLPDIRLSSLRVKQGVPADGKTIAELGLRHDYGVSVLAIQRGEQTISNPGADETINAGDVLYYLGSEKETAMVCGLFDNRARACVDGPGNGGRDQG
jgi:CPA2 family monovalent cation:H+ antiporter-2